MRPFMKIFLSLLFISTFSFAHNYQYEWGIGYGLTSLQQDQSFDLKHHTLYTTFQANEFFPFEIKPRLDFEYSLVDDDQAAPEHLYRFSLNFVYDIGKFEYQPYIMGGFGYELLDDEGINSFENSSFVQSGIGVEHILKNDWLFKVEFKGMTTFSEGDEYHLLAGIIIPFGHHVAHEVPIMRDEVPQVVEGFKKKIIEEVVDGDDDKDGVLNSVDECPQTPKAYRHLVDKKGCVANFILKVRFKADSYIVQKEYIPNIKEFANYMKAFSKYHAQIKGHISDDVTTSFGMQLSQDRANEIKKYLIHFGVQEDRLQSIGLGGYYPIASNKDPKTRPLNRRIEVRVFR